jgi:hypothetical protein
MVGWALICGAAWLLLRDPSLRVGVICGVAFVLAMVLRAWLAVRLELHPDRYAARVVRIDHATIDEVWDHLTSTASSRAFSPLASATWSSIWATGCAAGTCITTSTSSKRCGRPPHGRCGVDMDTITVVVAGSISRQLTYQPNRTSVGLAAQARPVRPSGH